MTKDIAPRTSCIVKKFTCRRCNINFESDMIRPRICYPCKYKKRKIYQTQHRTYYNDKMKAHWKKYPERYKQMKAKMRAKYAAKKKLESRFVIIDDSESESDV